MQNNLSVVQDSIKSSSFIEDECSARNETSGLDKHFVYAYLKGKNLDFIGSAIISKYLEGFELNPNLYLEVTSQRVDTIKQLESQLEVLIPRQDRKLNGAFFTPDYIVDFIIKETSPNNDDKVLDPSCGSGAFLLGLLRYYKHRFNKPIKSTLRDNLFGCDILWYNIERAKVIISIFALECGEVLEDSDFNLMSCDSLSFNWSTKFDVVVGNPPYVKFQDMTLDQRDALIRKWSTTGYGAFNLYFAFFELGYSLLSEDGRLGFITPNNYFTSLAGEGVRSFFQKKKCITKIVDFGHLLVFDVQTYTAITFLSKKNNEVFLYDKIESGDVKTWLDGLRFNINHTSGLMTKKWRLYKGDDEVIIKSIESIGTPLGALFDIAVGIATLKDEVFFLDSKKGEGEYCYKETKNGLFMIEKEITRSVYKISELKSQDLLDKNSRVIIFPYKIVRGKAVPIQEVEMALKYPECYKYLLSERSVLSSRDKGKADIAPFYAYGRTQGLTKTGPKLLTPTFSKQPRFLISSDEHALFTNGYGIYFSNGLLEGNDLFGECKRMINHVNNIRVVQKILNSVVMEYYVDRTSVSIQGGFPCYQKNFIERFGIPHLTERQIKHLDGLIDLGEINRFVCKIYNLDYETLKR